MKFAVNNSPNYSPKMIKPKVPNYENERLKELDSYNIIGEMEDFDYDFLTQLAAQICEAKISLISLITDEKQWFLSHHGLKVRETDKLSTFCAHAINTPEGLFLVEDARKDESFYDNPLVTGDPEVIFYAGVPLVNENDFPLGTLCVIDDNPKVLSEYQIHSLKMLSKQVMNQLELRRKSNELKQSNAALSKTTVLFNESQRINKIGAWELDLVTGITIWTDEVYEIHEVELSFEHNKVNGINFYHPDDQPIITTAIQHTIATGELYDVTCRFISAKGNSKIVRATGILWKENGEHPKLIGSFQDVTTSVKDKEKMAEALAKNQALFNASSQVCIITIDNEGIITSFNYGAELQLGYSADEMIGKETLDKIHLKEEIENIAKQKFPDIDFSELNTKDVFVSNAKLEIPETREFTYVRKDGTQFTVLLSITVIKQNDIDMGYLAVAIDISAIKKAENEKRKLLEVTREQNERLRNFSYIVSHNLRSHSSGISMLLNFIKEENPEIYALELLQHIKNASDNLFETIKHLTDVVQINLLKKQNTLSIVLKPIIDNNISSLLALAKNEGVKIINEIPSDIEVIGIPAYLQSIAMNFLSNGIKYSSNERESYVKISAEVTNDFVILIFNDNGLGIDLIKHKEKLFGIYKTFHQHKDSRGVGLFIAKNQIEAIGGHVEVESEVNVGSTFKIFLKHEKN
jgi:PAS domain S-box-containing protein